MTRIHWVVIFAVLAAVAGCGHANWGDSCQQSSDCASGLTCVHQGTVIVSDGGCSAGDAAYCGELCTGPGDACPEATQYTGSGVCTPTCDGQYVCLGHPKV